MITNFSIIIPARYRSTRFPGKPLVLLLGKPMLVWVAELSARAVGKSNVYIATEDQVIIDYCDENKIKCILTDPAETAIDRIKLFSDKVEADSYLNVQGDEPFFNPNDLKKLIKAAEKKPKEIINGYTEIKDKKLFFNSSIP